MSTFIRSFAAEICNNDLYLVSEFRYPIGISCREIYGSQRCSCKKLAVVSVLCPRYYSVYLLCYDCANDLHTAYTSMFDDIQLAMRTMINCNISLAKDAWPFNRCWWCTVSDERQQYRRMCRQRSNQFTYVGVCAKCTPQVLVRIHYQRYQLIKVILARTLLIVDVQRYCLMMFAALV